MNFIFSFLLIAAILFALITGGRSDALTRGIFEGASSAVQISLWLLGIVSLWMGILKILEDSGLVAKISKIAEPVIGRIFKNIPKGHPALSSITMNIIANIFGLGNAATPLGIKAMKDLKELETSRNKTDSTQSTNNTEEKSTEEITFEMMLFIVINTASIQLIPFTVVGILSEAGSTSPHIIIIPTIISTLLSALCAVGILFLARKISHKTSKSL